MWKPSAQTVGIILQCTFQLIGCFVNTILISRLNLYQNRVYLCRSPLAIFAGAHCKVSALGLEIAMVKWKKNLENVMRTVS